LNSRIFESKNSSHMPGSASFITVDHITVRLPNRLILEDSSWKIRSDEHWAVLGPNGSGKTTLVRSLWGGVPLRTGSVTFDFPGPHSPSQDVPPREAIGYVSLEMHQKLMEQEELKEEFRSYAGENGEGTTAQEVIFSGILAHRTLNASDETRLSQIARLLDIGFLLPRSIPSLSTGEVRKVLIARALMKSPRLLILDEPFEGLDEGARKTLARDIDQLMAGPLRVILVAHRLEEIVPHITHVLLVKEGRLFRQGPKDEILTSFNLSQLYGCELQVEKKNGTYSLSYGAEKDREIELPPACREMLSESDVLIQMRDTSVRYGDLVALDRLNWSMKRGENWAILGPNGAGKSTLVKLILGENLQAYANEIFLFGRRRGSGETIWEIRKRLGVISAELQVQYRKRMSSYEVIASGFYDSIGLYRVPAPEEKEAVDRWVDLLEMKDLAKEPFHQLSFGQKRMILLARAMVKSPLVLIADEPCQGLDVANRRRILKILERIGEMKTHLLYITDRHDEILDCITHVMLLQRGRVVREGRKEEVLRKGGPSA
jgi:molybdate transport system ATP-binding protein